MLEILHNLMRYCMKVKTMNMTTKILLSGIFLSGIIGCDKVDKMTSLENNDFVFITTDFETHDIFPPWEKQGNSESFSIVTEAPRKGNYCARFLIDSSEYWTSPYSGIKSARSEIQIFNVAPAQKEIYYGWSVKIPEDYIESSDWQVIGQFHDQPDFEHGETWDNYPANSPPVSLTYKNGKIGLTVNIPHGFGSEVISERLITKGQWTDLILHLYWSTSSDGYIEAWINEIPMTDHSGTITRYSFTNLYNNSGNYLKIGLYRSNEITTKNIVYFDEIKSGLNYNDVKIKP
jgi:Polysaccharide lyase